MWTQHYPLKDAPDIHKVKQRRESQFSNGVKRELLNSSIISLSIYSIENKMSLRNTQLRTYSTLRYISLPSIDTPTPGHIAFSLQSLYHPLVDRLLIHVMPKSWDAK